MTELVPGRRKNVETTPLTRSNRAAYLLRQHRCSTTPSFSPVATGRSIRYCRPLVATLNRNERGSPRGDPDAVGLDVITSSIRIWKRLHVKVGGKYRLGEGYEYIVVDSIDPALTVSKPC